SRVRRWHTRSNGVRGWVKEAAALATNSCPTSGVPSTKEVEQAQEQVQNIEVDANGQQNCCRHGILGELDPLNVVHEKAAEERYTHQSDDKRQRATSEEQAKDARNDDRQQSDEQNRPKKAQVAF